MKQLALCIVFACMLSGISSYLILDKEGNRLYFRVGFEGASVIEKKLSEAL